MRLKTTVISVALSALSVGGAMAQQVVDVHCHNIMPDFTNSLDAHDAALDETFPLPEWNVESHLAFMDSAGIRISVLSMPAPQPYFGNADECRDIIRRYNEQTAAICREHPERFKFVAALPLPDVRLSIEEVAYAFDTLGAVGVKLATNSRGQYLGDAELEPLMQVLNKHKAVVIIHPHKPVPVNDNIIATAPLAVYEYPAETTRTIINLIARNVPARYPDIKWIVPHCGSFLPMAIPRMKAVLPVMVAKGLMQPVDFEANLARFYYDLAGAPSAEAIESMLTITTPDHIMYGSDYPYQPAAALVSGMHRLEQMLSNNRHLSQYKSLFLTENAVKIFNLQENEK
ncbi:amidohydrolase family protein [Palleniella muris]|uniref:amidohydrolase family protein n=1 Tax=Palleniella muris TaxID=3038145 RepID=UPI0024101E21|nr:amidohydrolase family protein [Palleniella muris]